MNTYKNKEPFRFWCQKVLPLVYDNSLSYYEMLCKTVNYLNNVINDVNSLGQNVNELMIAFNSLKSYVDNYFENLNVQEEINKKLDELVKDGTLSALINNILIKTPTSNFADLEYLCSIQNHYPYKTDTEDYLTTPTEPQGIAYIDNENVVCFYSCGEKTGGFGAKNDPVMIREFHFTDDRTSSFIVREKLITGLQHANSASYDKTNNVIYVALRGYANSDNTGIVDSTDIAIVDYATLFVKEIKHVSMPDGYNRIDVIGFDKINNILYCGTEDKIFKINADWSATLVFSWTKEYTYAHNLQGLCVIDDYFYICTHNPNTIFCYNNKGGIAKILNFPEYDEDGHAIRYPEDIDYDPISFDVYINAWAGTSLLGYNEVGQWRSCYVFKFNPFKNVITSHRQSESGLININKTIYVNSNNKSIYQKGSEAYPYTLINEAINAVISGTKDIFIDANGSFDEYVNIQGINCSFIGELNVNSINIQSALVRFEKGLILSGKNVTNSVCRIINSIVNINNKFVINGGYENQSGLYISNGELNTDFSFDISASNCKYAISLINSKFNGYCNNITPKRCFISLSSVDKKYLPDDTIIDYNGHIEMYLPKNKGNKVGTNFYGTLSAVVELTIGKTVRTVQSTPIRCYAGSSDTITFLPTYFGFISVHVNDSLEITSVNLINVNESDLSNVSANVIGLHLE